MGTARQSGRAIDPGSRASNVSPAILVVLAFISPGAWLITRLPPVPIAMALNLATVAVWLLAAGLGLLRLSRVDRRVLVAIGAVGASILVSYVLGGSLLEVALYDLYGDMSLLQWLTLPAVFLLAASLNATVVSVRRGLVVVVAFAALLGGVMTFQSITTGATTVFGSTSYSVPALACTIPLAVGLAGEARGAIRFALYGAAAFVTVALGVFSGSTMGAVAVVFAVTLALAMSLSSRSPDGRPGWIRFAAFGIAAMMAVALLMAQTPVLAGRWVNAETLGGFDSNVITRAYLWEGAQEMVAVRPVFGFGPSGYRLAAAEYLPLGVHEYGPGALGDVDPTAYSPQSPHSVMWDIATRLGLVGLATFVALFAAWALALRRRILKNDATAPLRLALAAGFGSALFALTVNPSVFAIGLLAPAVAGLAIAPLRREEGTSGRSMTRNNEVAPAEVSKAARIVLTVLGACLLVLSAWLGTGEMQARGVSAEDPVSALRANREVLRIIPGYPQTVRKDLELGLLTAVDDQALSQAQQAVDDAPAHVAAFAPNLVSIAAYSLVQADRTGRTDVEWERNMLTRAAEALPMVPSLAGELLHLALIEGDRDTIAGALRDAERWGRAYALTEGYIQRAGELLGSDG